MELTLLPITALLLLLSGAVAPARLGGEGAGTGAFLCWLGRESAPGASSRAHTFRASLSVRKPSAHQSFTRERAEHVPPAQARGRLRTLSRKLLRTRFGVETAAYQAAAPPAA